MSPTTMWIWTDVRHLSSDCFPIILEAFSQPGGDILGL